MRAAVAHALATLNCGGRERMVRVNGVGTTDLVEDLRARPLDRVDALFVSEVRDVAHVAILERLVAGYEGQRGPPVPFVLTIETPDALFRAGAVAAASHRRPVLRLRRLCRGNRLRADGRGARRPARPIAAAAGSAGLEAIDAAVFADVRDAEAARADALVARALGFTGKVVFHPNQLAPVNEVFTPTADESPTRAGSLTPGRPRARADCVGLAGGEFVAIDIVRMMERVLARAAATSGTVART